ncbi:MAG TPA: sodium:proton exchanger [Flavobacteriia bacterium]|nr:sodium:proton exchanger [Flavobacteriia bacterium]
MLILFNMIKPEYLIIAGLSIIIIISFIFNYISRKTSIPSVLLLMVLGISLQYLIPDITQNKSIFELLIIIGKMGLILIVLEAALDLKIKKDEIGLIVRAFIAALIILIVSSFAIAFILQYFLEATFFNAFVYAVPLSVMSSAIVIPSVSSLSHYKKEFMIYESAFSDILGIILFQFLLNSENYYSVSQIAFSLFSNIFITLIVAVVFGYITVWGIQKLTSHVKLFLIIAVLMLVYAIGSIFHLSSLIIILVFGIILNNSDLFFKGKLEQLIDKERIKEEYKGFYIVTLESSFLLRTVFFVMFGVTISLASLTNLKVAEISFLIIVALYLVRFIFLKIILWKKTVFPEVFTSPRGLITVLLFYSIPNDFKIENFDQGIIMYIIIATSVIMTFALIWNKRKTRKLKILLDEYNKIQKDITDIAEESFTADDSIVK